MVKKTQQYKRRILKELCFGNILSALEISNKIEKSLPLTNRLLNELVKEGFIKEKGYATSTGGRRPQMYYLKADLNYIVSVAMDQLITTMGILDMHNNVIGEIEKFEIPLKNNLKAAEQLRNCLIDFINKSEVQKSKIAGIGIGMPGFVDSQKGINHSFFFPGDESIADYIESEIEIPVLIDNDSSLIGLAELRLGAARNHRNTMVINIGWGVGLGMILNGELFRGHNGFAGEFSHIPVFKDNKKICSCGKTGCLETETSLLAIIGKAIAGLEKGKMSVLKNLSFDNVEESCSAIMEAAAKGDTFAIELFSEAGYNLGLGIAILITLLNPELIVLSGRGAAAGKLWLAPIQQAINEHCIAKIAEDTEVKISTFDHKVNLIGAAALVMENYEAIPTMVENIKLKTVLNL